MPSWADLSAEERAQLYHCRVTGPKYGTPPPGYVAPCGWIADGVHYHCIVEIMPDGTIGCNQDHTDSHRLYAESLARWQTWPEPDWSTVAVR